MQRRTGPTADRFIETLVDLIAEKGGSVGVNLREIARRMGIGHTNLYNYFDTFDDLLWAGQRRVLDDYAAWWFRDLDESLPRAEYLQRLVTNLVTYPQQKPGLYRFISTDPIGSTGFPSEILDAVVPMKQQLLTAFARCAPEAGRAVTDRACDMVYAYIDGEILNLINNRVVPGEDIASRVVDNAVYLFELLTTTTPS